MEPTNRHDHRSAVRDRFRLSWHAATIARRDNRHGQEALLRYVHRPSLAQSRLQMLDSALCRTTLRRAFSDGTYPVATMLDLPI